MLHIEAMSWQSHIPNSVPSQQNADVVPSQQNVAGVSPIQSGNNTRSNVVQNAQSSTSIGNSTQDSLAWWKKKSFFSRVVSWINGEVYFFAHNNKVVALEFKGAADLQNSLNNFSQNFSVNNQSFENTDVSFFKRLKAVVWGDELKEVEREKMEAAREKWRLIYLILFVKTL